MKIKSNTYKGIAAFFLMVMLFGQAGCQTATINAPLASNTTPPMAVDDFRLSPGDTIRVNVFRDPDLSGEYKIDPNGLITMPLVGQIPAQHATIPLLVEDITNRLSEGYLIEPIVTVEVVSLRPIYISGEVRNPGSYDYEPSLNTFKAVALAGGLTPRAVRNEYLIIRGSGRDTKRLKARDTTPVWPGDSIQVNERFF